MNMQEPLLSRETLTWLKDNELKSKMRPPAPKHVFFQELQKPDSGLDKCRHLMTLGLLRMKERNCTRSSSPHAGHLPALAEAGSPHPTTSSATGKEGGTRTINNSRRGASPQDERQASKGGGHTDRLRHSLCYTVILHSHQGLCWGSENTKDRDKKREEAVRKVKLKRSRNVCGGEGGRRTGVKGYRGASIWIKEKTGRSYR